MSVLGSLESDFFEGVCVTPVILANACGEGGVFPAVADSVSGELWDSGDVSQSGVSSARDARFGFSKVLD